MRFEAVTEHSGHATDSKPEKSNCLINCCLQLPKGELCRGWSQTQRNAAIGPEEKVAARKILNGYKEKVLQQE